MSAVIALSVLAYLSIGGAMGLFIIGMDAASRVPKVTRPLAVFLQWALLWPGIIIVLGIVMIASLIIFGVKGDR